MRLTDKCDCGCGRRANFNDSVHGMNFWLGHHELMESYNDWRHDPEGGLGIQRAMAEVRDCRDE